MKKLTRKRITAAGIIAGAMISSSAMMSGCIFGRNEAVYGPPPDEVYEPDQNEIEAVYGPPDDLEQIEIPTYEPDLNELEDVYGPPEDFE